MIIYSQNYLFKRPARGYRNKINFVHFSMAFSNEISYPSHPIQFCKTRCFNCCGWFFLTEMYLIDKTDWGNICTHIINRMKYCIHYNGIIYNSYPYLPKPISAPEATFVAANFFYDDVTTFKFCEGCWNEAGLPTDNIQKGVLFKQKIGYLFLIKSQ